LNNGRHFCWWNRTILKPIQRYGGEGDGRIAFERLVVLLDQMMLRRTKIERADDLGLPPRLVEIRRDYFNEKELDFYRALYSETRTRFASYVRTGTVLNNFAHM
jgi:DNA repair protein RAD16